MPEVCQLLNSGFKGDIGRLASQLPPFKQSTYRTRGDELRSRSMLTTSINEGMSRLRDVGVPGAFITATPTMHAIFVPNIKLDAI